MNALASDAPCVLCGQLATETVEPPRRTLARGVDAGDPSYSVTVILADIALCAEHGLAVREGERVVGWCDDPQCRSYGELGEPSACAKPYTKLVPQRRT